MRLRVRKVAVILCAALVATWIFLCNLPLLPRLCGFPEGLPITSPRIKLRDGRYLAYEELGVPRKNAKHKIVYLHGFANSKRNVVIADRLPKAIFEELDVCIISFDRPGYGESDPDPNRSLKSISQDIEELADQLELGDKFYLSGFSLGGQIVWGSFKYITHRLEGAVLISPAINYWWHGFPPNLAEEAFQKQLPQDQWAQRVAYYVPWLTYWWNTQTYFPGSSVTALALSSKGYRIHCSVSDNTDNQVQVKQGAYESLHLDMMIGFGKWDFSPMDLANPIPGKEGVVHVWQGDNDKLVPVELQRYIAKKLPWITYYEVPGAGHMFALSDGKPEAILRALLAKK
ncbi:hypothetical protein vseg_001011 [Gypsophila vaccaria]